MQRATLILPANDPTRQLGAEVVWTWAESRHCPLDVWSVDVRGDSVFFTFTVAHPLSALEREAFEAAYNRAFINSNITAQPAPAYGYKGNA